MTTRKNPRPASATQLRGTWLRELVSFPRDPSRIRPESFQKALWITSHYEGAGFKNTSGDFDQQGVSLGILQWCLGQGSLQPVLRDIFDAVGTDTHKYLQQGRALELLDVIKMPITKAVAWGNRISVKRGGKATSLLVQPWKTELENLLTDPRAIAVQNRWAEAKMRHAAGLCERFGLKTERALAVAFDVLTQQGSINAGVEKEIRASWAKLPEGSTERDKLRVLVRVRASPARKQYIQDVLSRKLTIVEGHGVVHGTKYDFTKEPGLTDQPYELASGAIVLPTPASAPKPEPSKPPKDTDKLPDDFV